MQDVRYALRLWRRNPGLVAIALAALALGIGATTTVFTVVRTVLVRPLPYHAPEELVLIWERNLPRQRDRNVVAPSNFIHWDERNASFTDLAAFSGMTFDVALTGAGEPRAVESLVVSASLFAVLGVEAGIGRTFRPEEDRPQSDTVIVSHRLWRTALGGDPRIVGRAVMLDDRPRTVVGVMPAGFTFVNPTVDAWLPIGFPPEARQPRGRWLGVVGRLRPGVTRARAQADMESVVAGLTREFPAFNLGWSVNVVPVQEDLVGRARPALLVLLSAIVCVLLIACANVANLLLAQASARQRELAVRTALGATRWRVVRQLLVESGLLAAAGGALGLALAWAGLHALSILPPGVVPIPRLADVALDGTVLAFGLALSGLSGLLFGAAPALGGAAIDLGDALKEGSRGAGVRRGAAARAVLVTAEMALAIVLLAGAGLLVRSFSALTNLPLGFDPDGAVTVAVSLPSARYPADHHRLAFFRQLLADLEARPEIAAAGAISWLPMNGAGSATTFVAVGAPRPRPGEEPVTEVRIVEGDLFRALGIRLLQGRLFTGLETGDAARVVVVNRTMAERMWPGADPLGRRLQVSWGPQPGEETVIGVVDDIRAVDFETPVRPMIFWPHGRSPSSRMHVIARGTGSTAGAAAVVAAGVRARDRALAFDRPRPMPEVIAAAVFERRLTMTVLGGFAAAAVLLAAIGIYGVMAYTVTRRTQEIGIRMALGAERRAVLGMVLRETLSLAGAGVAIGLAAAWLLSRLMRTLLYEVEPGDPLTLAFVAAALIAVALVAGYVPGRRAARIDPLAALRCE